MDINVDLLQRSINCLIKKFGGAVKIEIMQNQHTLDLPMQQLAEELHKPIIIKFEKHKVHPSFIDNTWGADLADMQLISRFNKRFQILLCVINIYSKYLWVILLKDKTVITITNALQKILDESGYKANNMWVDKGSEFYNRLMKLWLQENDQEMYSAHNEGKSTIARILVICY